jgi:hypothetical protein
LYLQSRSKTMSAHPADSARWMGFNSVSASKEGQTTGSKPNASRY